jgi:hypothetical protein
MKDYFKETYLVRYDLYHKDIGYWIRNAEELVNVVVKHGVNEKNNHEKAGDILKEKFSSSVVDIQQIIYV